MVQGRDAPLRVPTLIVICRDAILGVRPHPSRTGRAEARPYQIDSRHSWRPIPMFRQDMT